MGKFIGIDFGSNMIKAASSEDAGHDAMPLELGDNNPFFPAVLQLDLKGKGFRAGWPAYANRRRFGYQMAAQFRDRVQPPHSSLSISGQSFDGVTLQTALLLNVREVLQSRYPDIAALTLAVPDHWNDNAWSFPIAVQQAGCNPKMFVREWCAVLATQDVEAHNEVLLLSLGAGGIRGTLCQRQHSHWMSTFLTVDPTISGNRLRKEVTNQIAEEIIRSYKKDPREDADADQSLYDCVDRALWQLCCVPNTNVQIPVFKQVYQRALTRDHLRSQLPNIRSNLESFVENTLNNPQVNLPKCPIIAWGELAMLFPVGEWLARFCPSGQRPNVVPLGKLAEGAARLCAQSSANAAILTADNSGSLCPQCGMYSATWVGEQCIQCQQSVVPLMQGLPSGTSSPKGHAQLVLLEDSHESEIVPLLDNWFRLGRHPQSEWMFEAQRFPTVSGAHAVIIHEGSQYVVKDLNSLNGTFVNGRQIRQPTPLHDGDQINLGQDGPSLRFDAPG